MGFPQLRCEQVGRSYQTRNGTMMALKEVTFTLGEREFLCIVGPSGCGKTTLLKVIAGLLEPTSGRIIFAAPPPNGKLRTALVFQEHGLFPWMTVLDNVAFGLEVRGVGRKERHRKALAFIERVGLAPFVDRYPHQLSVGMRQRAGIARSLVADPQILLMDEPFSSLDAQTRRLLQEELLELWEETHVAIVYVTHDIGEALLLGDRVLVMTGHPGSIREEILVPLSRPRDPSDSDRTEVTALKRHIWKILEEEVRATAWTRR